MNKKVAVLIIVLIVLATGSVLLYMGKKQNLDQGGKDIPAGQVNTKSLPFEVKKESNEKLPPGFVAGFPLEKDSEILNNYSAETPDGLLATRQFVTKKTLAENYKIYTDYFKKNGWTIVTAMDEESSKQISATSKTGVKAEIVMSQNSVTKANKIDLTFMTPPKVQ